MRLLIKQTITAFLRDLKRSLLYGRWKSGSNLREDGYSILLGCPMDMPFLLRLAFRVLSHTDTSKCNEILVVPDGSSEDGGKAIKTVIDEISDPRVRYVEPGLRWKVIMPYIHNHPAMMVMGTETASNRFVFIHDLDAFFTHCDTIEQLFDEFKARSLVAMGVTARWDPKFLELDYKIPGTQELFYDKQWLMSWPREMVFGRKEQCSNGMIEFDSLLYPLFLEYPSGRIGISNLRHDIVHFNGTIRSFRVFKQNQRRSAASNDKLFRLLLLTVLEDIATTENSMRITPTISMLTECLVSKSGPIHYDLEKGHGFYAEFRDMINLLTRTPSFDKQYANQIRSKLVPFDACFQYEGV